MQHSDFRFRERLRVRWAEIDAQKIVFNGHYLTYFDTALAGYWRALAVPYAQTMEALGGDTFVRKATLEYLASARYDDVLEIGMRCSRIGTSSMTFSGGVFRQNELLVSTELVYVFADPREQRSKPVPPALRALFESYEQGLPMVELHVGSWADLQALARPIREAVFIAEQHVPVDLEWDEDDAGAVHAVALNRLGLPLATGRLLQPEPGVAKIGRMAVIAAARHGGTGRAVLDALIGVARARGDREVVLDAQSGAVPFYERAGFSERGTRFEEVGIEHVEMARSL